MTFTFLTDLLRGVRADWWFSLLALALGLVVVLGLLMVTRSPALTTISERFTDRVNLTIASQPLSPLVVTVYERAVPTRHNHYTTDVVELLDRNHDDDGSGGDENRVLDLSYNERLIVVKPHNWMIYTNNGLNFYLITNNVSNRTAQCDLDLQMIAVDFRLQTIEEPDEKRDRTGRLKIACINYTLDNLIRLFGIDAHRTYLDLSGYFDARLNPSAPPVIVDEIINYLLLHDLV